MMTAKPISWTMIVIGILGFGAAYGELRGKGTQTLAASIFALVGPQGILIAIGITGLMLSKKRR